MPTSIAVFLIFFIATFTQSVIGFGSALIAMGGLSTLLGLKTAAPLFALVSILLEIILLVYYRHTFNFRAIRLVILGAMAGIPVGLAVLNLIPETITLTFLGFILVGYALYAFLNFRLPELRHPVWALTLGVVSGILGGAYNTAGPPIIIYGNCRRWPPVEFKANLQGFFLVGSVLIAIGHGLASHFTSLVWQNFIFAIPAVFLGIPIGTKLDPVINPLLFRKIVLLGLILLGVNLILQ